MELCVVCCAPKLDGLCSIGIHPDQLDLSQLHIGGRQHGDYWITIDDFEKGMQKSPRLIKTDEWRLAVRVIANEFRENHDQKLFWRRLWEISDHKEWPAFLEWLFKTYDNPTWNEKSAFAREEMILKWSWIPPMGDLVNYQVSPNTLVTGEVALRLIEEGGKDRPFAYAGSIKKAVETYRKDGKASKFWLAVLDWLKTPDVIRELLKPLIPTKKVESTYCIEIPEVFPSREKRDPSPKPTKRPPPKPVVFPPVPPKAPAPRYPEMTRQRFKDVWDKYQIVTTNKSMARNVYTYWHDFTGGKNLQLILPDNFWATLWAMMGPSEMETFLDLADI